MTGRRYRVLCYDCAECGGLEVLCCDGEPRTLEELCPEPDDGLRPELEALPTVGAELWTGGGAAPLFRIERVGDALEAPRPPSCRSGNGAGLGRRRSCRQHHAGDARAKGNA